MAMGQKKFNKTENSTHRIINKFAFLIFYFGDFHLPFRTKVCILENILNATKRKTGTR